MTNSKTVRVKDSSFEKMIEFLVKTKGTVRYGDISNLASVAIEQYLETRK